MVFGRLGDGFDLLRAEPFAQLHVRPDDAPRDEMVGFPVFAESRIVVGGRRIDQVGIDVVEGGERQRLGDHRLHVVAPVPRIEGIVAGNDFLLHIRPQVRIDAR